MKITYFTIYMFLLIISSIMIFHINLFLSLFLIISAVISIIIKFKNIYNKEKILLNDLQYVAERTESLRSKKINLSDLDELFKLEKKLNKIKKHFINVHNSTTVQIYYYDDIIYTMKLTIKESDEYFRSQKLNKILK